MPDYSTGPKLSDEQIKEIKSAFSSQVQGGYQDGIGHGGYPNSAQQNLVQEKPREQNMNEKILDLQALTSHQNKRMNELEDQLIYLRQVLVNQVGAKI